MVTPSLCYSLVPCCSVRCWKKAIGCVRLLVLNDRPGFGDVCVKGFDDGGVLLFDDAALELEGEGEAAVIESKIFGEKSEALDGFVLREMDGEALDLGVDQRMHPRMRGQFNVGGKLNSLVSGFGGDGRGVRDDERDDKFASVADDHGV